MFNFEDQIRIIAFTIFFFLKSVQPFNHSYEYNPSTMPEMLEEGTPPSNKHPLLSN